MSSAEKSDGKTKKRSDMACTSCRRRKLKCENKDSTPPCRRCDHDKADCVFVPVSDDRTDRNSKTPSGSRGSSEDRKSNSQLAMSPPTSHASQVTPPSLRRTDRPTNSGITVSPPTHYTSPSYFPSGQPVRPDTSNYNDGPHHLYGDSHPIPEPSQVLWSDTQYAASNGSNGRYGDHIHISQMQQYSYSNPSYPQPVPVYHPDHHPRAIPRPPASPYYNPLNTPQIPQAHYPYYPPQQPSGLVAFPDSNNTTHGHPCDNSHFCDPFPR